MYYLAAGGRIAPGASAGNLTADSVSLSHGTLEIALNGSTPGAGYDQLTSSGPVLLGGTLELSADFLPDPGTSFVILNNTGIDSVAGSFAELPEGTTFTAEESLFDITYAGGDGNDVVTLQQALLPTLIIVPGLPGRSGPLVDTGQPGVCVAGDFEHIADHLDELTQRFEQPGDVVVDTQALPPPQTISLIPVQDSRPRTPRAEFRSSQESAVITAWPGHPRRVVVREIAGGSRHHEIPDVGPTVGEQGFRILDPDGLAGGHRNSQVDCARGVADHGDGSQF